MSKLRRLRVPALQNRQLGDVFALPPEEAQHARVLRLKDGAVVEIADDGGRRVQAKLFFGGEVSAQILAVLNEGGREISGAGGVRLQLAAAWPKGKRAALLVEKCCELGVDRLLPVRYARGTVSKDDASAGLARLRRIAVSAAKQSGRETLPQIAAEKELKAVLAEEAKEAVAVALEPSASRWLPEILAENRLAVQNRPLLLFIGPEGGFAPEELEAFKQAGIPPARIAETLLRVETAALAACAIVGAACLWQAPNKSDRSDPSD
jgi:16S rRNA (uracil1498-N3)-methyltransferase